MAHVNGSPYWPGNDWSGRADFNLVPEISRFLLAHRALWEAAAYKCRHHLSVGKRISEYGDEQAAVRKFLTKCGRLSAEE
jgi:hypothetical protein